MFGNRDNGGNIKSSISPIWGSTHELDAAVNSCLVRVFFRMFIALLITAATAFAVSTSDALIELITENMVVWYGLLIGQIALVFIISLRIEKMAASTANLLFILYSFIMGVTLSLIFLVYEIGLIYQAFGITALMFSAMAAFGAITKRDLTSVGSFCFMGLFGVIIASVVNMFLRSEMLDYIISYIAIFVFLGLTAYDTKRIKTMLYSANESGQNEAIAKISTIGALWLYLDFINLFLRVLRIMGRRR